MKLKRNAMVIGLFTMIMLGSAPFSAAQDDAKPTTHRKVRTLTGCLQKSDDANEYMLTTKSGGTWEMRSDSVKMAPHVGHTVTVTGVVRTATLHALKEDTKTEAREQGVNKDSTEHGHLTVTALKMVSHDCSN
jgi:hypothetical protein